MNGYDFIFCGVRLCALGSGALWWPEAGVLCVSDLHLCKSERVARRTGRMLPPYEVRDTLARLEADIARTGCGQVVCLGDSFDDLAAADALGTAERKWLSDLMTGRGWSWIEGNHDPGPLRLGGSQTAALSLPPLVFRHIAAVGHDTGDAQDAGEISGHYHPKARLALRGGGITRPCFLVDRARIVMPAYGTYTGGLNCDVPVLCNLMQPGAIAILTGPTARAVPMPRQRGQQAEGARAVLR